jgi:DNA-binding transcriptional regulator GbsR (MarR family)
MNKSKKAKRGRAGAGGFAEAAAGFEDGVARICRVYGVSPILGRLYAVLFLAPEPLGLDELCAKVAAAKSTASVALRQLLSLHLVERLPPRGDRRDFYRAVTDPWALLADWSRIYFQPELEMWRSTGAALEQALGKPDAPRGEERRALHERLLRMAAFVELFQELLGDLTQSRAQPPPSRSIPIRLDGSDDEDAR